MSKQDRDDKSLREKAEFFDELASRFYERNFGTLSKSEFDLLMFHFYCRLHCNQSGEFDSYTVSKTLGITQERVRNLTVKEYLAFSREIDWKELFTKKLKKRIQYNELEMTVEIPVLDPTVFMEIEHQIEVYGGCVRYMQNRKILSLSLVDFSKLLVRADEGVPEDQKDNVQQLVEKAYKDNKKCAPREISKLLKGIFVQSASSVPSLLLTVLNNFSPFFEEDCF